MLCLKSKTNPEWINAALNNMDSILNDHAHCEKKAAATGLSLISSYPDKTEIALGMSDLVEEEIGHFKSVVEILQKEGKKLRKDEANFYVKKILSHVRTHEPVRLLDRLLTAGIIEARSCERLQILAENLSQPELKKFYSDLSASEAGHYVSYINIAKGYFKLDEVIQRLNELADIEKDIVEKLSNKPLIHG
jgi:tRNA 2-(methylsulfanyl)-N6-isopentenyladenosine37 hydroxylase